MLACAVAAKSEASDWLRAFLCYHRASSKEKGSGKAGESAMILSYRQD